jgi:hypothetical protein
MGRRFAVALLLALITAGSAQSNPNDQEIRNIDTTIESLRADLRADKTELITQVMSFSADEGKIFWPVYRKYETELIALNDQRSALIKRYSEKYASMTDPDAKAILGQALDFETKRAELKQKYAREFERAGLSPVTTTKFFQFEHRLDALVDLQLASELPALFVVDAVK